LDWDGAEERYENIVANNNNQHNVLFNIGHINLQNNNNNEDGD
jgi:hypothetical protein